MTNPNDAVGTNAAYGGRTSANAFNDDLAAYTRGILSGWGCLPNSGLTVSLGGDGSTRDVAVAEDNAGNKISINNISGSPIDVTLNAAPGANSRIDLVVAYVDNPPQGSSTVADNPSACGIIKVTGTASSTPVAPNDSAIRTAITGDGASGTTAYYVILAQITVTSGTTDITTSNIQAGANAMIQARNVEQGIITCYNTSSASTALTQSYANCLTVDISRIPTGAKFIARFSASSTGTSTDTAFSIRCTYNGTDSMVFVQTTSWGKNVSGADVFTKASGANTLYLQARKDNTSDVSITSRICTCTVIY